MNIGKTCFPKEDNRIANISGNTNDLKKKQIARLKKLSEKKLHDDVALPSDFAKELGLLSRELKKVLGLLVDRQGVIRYFIAGDSHRIFIPELERRSESRLRGLRLIRTDLSSGKIKQEDIYDLTLLRLDYLTVLKVAPDGTAASVQNAHILPGVTPGYEIQKATTLHQQQVDVLAEIDSLEELFLKEKPASRVLDKKPKALLVGVYTPQMRQTRSPDDSIIELRELCRTAGVVPLEKVISQRKSRLDPKTAIGSGKAYEIAIEAVQLNADMIIFDLELSSAQALRISKITDLKIIDRTQLILDIFAKNASSRDGKLQVELAQLNYLKGRLSEKDDNMSRLTGGIGGRGPGETKLEIGRRRVHERITRLENELGKLKNRRFTNRARRRAADLPIVAIVGYTNAGKSTLLNALTNSEVISENRLFATLDTTTRRLRFPQEKEIILSDTVGFIHDLPPELEKAFSATLEELTDADLLLHCVDASSPFKDQQIKAVESILGEIGLLEIPMIQVFNKIDRIDEEQKETLSQQKDAILVSASKKINLDILLKEIESIVMN